MSILRFPEVYKSCRKQRHQSNLLIVFNLKVVQNSPSSFECYQLTEKPLQVVTSLTHAARLLLLFVAVRSLIRSTLQIKRNKT